jgi:small-conductance mechanosensitive channel
MLSQLVYLLFLGFISGSFWYLSGFYPFMVDWFYSAIWVSALYAVIKVGLQGLVSKSISNDEMRYKFRKTTGVLFWVASFVIVLRIWIPNPQALLVAYGLVGAGIAIALQDFFKNFVGGIIIFVNGVYRVGDRIEINNEFGDVIDIGLFYTTVMELREWVSGDQATGRICSVPNGFVLGNVVNNYTRDHEFIWDEIFVPITYDSDYGAAKKILIEIAQKETNDIMKKAESEFSHMKTKFYVSKREMKPDVFVQMTDNWIALYLRYISPVKSRRMLNNLISQKILNAFSSSKKIKIASTTLKLVK